MIERGPWYYFIPPMKDYVPKRVSGHICNARCYYTWPDSAGRTTTPPSLLQIMLDEDEAAKKQNNG